MVRRYGIANIDPALIAKAGQAAGLAGSVSAGFGFGAWGVEPTTFLEIAGADAARADAFVLGLLASHGEQAAYRTTDGTAPTLLWANGTVEVLT